MLLYLIPYPPGEPSYCPGGPCAGSGCWKWGCGGVPEYDICDRLGCTTVSNVMERLTRWSLVLLPWVAALVEHWPSWSGPSWSIGMEVHLGRKEVGIGRHAVGKVHWHWGQLHKDSPLLHSLPLGPCCCGPPRWGDPICGGMYPPGPWNIMLGIPPWTCWGIPGW